LVGAKCLVELPSCSVKQGWKSQKSEVLFLGWQGVVQVQAAAWGGQLGVNY